MGVDPCVNPESAQCANPQDYAQGYGPWGISGADDPCVYLNNAGNGVESVDTHSSPKECRNTGGQWVPPGAAAALNPDGTVFVINNPSFYIGSNALDRLTDTLGPWFGWLDWLNGPQADCIVDELVWGAAQGAAAGALATRTLGGTAASALGGVGKGAVTAVRVCRNK